MHYFTLLSTHSSVKTRMNYTKELTDLLPSNKFLYVSLFENVQKRANQEQATETQNWQKVVKCSQKRQRYITEYIHKYYC